MKCRIYLSRVLALAAGLASVSTTPLCAQSIVGPPAWTSASIHSTGGISYFAHVATLWDCDGIEIGPVSRVGTNLSLTATVMRGEICPLCVDCDHTETTATVLGSLPSGAYRLLIYTPPPFGGPGVWLFRAIDFEVPAGYDPTLVVSRGDSGVQIEVRGVAAANYTVEGSADLIHWSTAKTVIGAPFTFTVDPAGAPFRFYRVAVASGTVISR